MTQPPVIQLSLATALPAYRPGDTVTALLHASTSLPEDIELKEVEIVFAGVERVDVSWVSPSYRKGVPAINSDRRRVQRNVVLASLQAATQGNFSDANLRRFIIRFKLPSWLPPTFKGTAVRYSYYLDAHMAYFQYDAGVVAAAAATGVDPPKQGKPGSISTRLALHIWPDQGPLNENTAAANSSQTSPAQLGANGGGGGSNGGSNGDDVFPLVLGEDGAIKCWEVGPGTAVEDAINHISKLVTAGSGIPPSPFSPGHMKRSLSQQGSSGPLLAASSGSGGALDLRSQISGIEGTTKHRESDSASEISHNEDGPLGASSGFLERAASRHESGAAAASLSRLSLASEATDRSNTTNATTGAQGNSSSAAEAGGAGGLRTFALRIGDDPLVKVSVHPPLMGPLLPGGTVAGTLEFPTSTTASSLRCMQMSVMLETEETVDSVWRPTGKGAASSAASMSSGGNSSLRKVLEEQIEVIADTTCTNFIFSLPRDATPTFQTPLVALRWVLRFHFMAMRQGQGGKMEQLSWALPLVVLPPPKAA